MANFTVKVCYPNWLKIASIVCPVVSYSSRTERLLTRQSWLKTGLPPTNCSDFVGKDEWPPNSPDLKPLDYHVWGAVRERYKTFQPKPNTIDELKKVLQSTWDDLPLLPSSQRKIIRSHSAVRHHVQCGGCKDPELNAFAVNYWHQIFMCNVINVIFFGKRYYFYSL